MLQQIQSRQELNRKKLHTNVTSSKKLIILRVGSFCLPLTPFISEPHGCRNADRKLHQESKGKNIKIGLEIN
jgi:hypothetical protein